MPFNYQAFIELKERESLSVLAFALELREFEPGYPISPGQINYWSHIGYAKIKPEELSSTSTVPMKILAERERGSSDIPLEDIAKNICKEDTAFIAPIVEDIDLLFRFAKSRGHTDLQFYVAPK